MQNFLKLSLVVLVMVIVTGCSRVSDEDVLAGREAVKNGAMIIDVRSKKEYNKGHIEGSVNIPIAYVDKMYNSLPRDKELVVYCRSGSRSAIAARLLREQGWIVHDVETQEDWERKIIPKPVVQEK
ncbi:MAG: sulfurtransferase [Arcobacter sp.]|nr:MAG: sulfurtransferase [Arcobacter sp.]